MNGSDDIPRVLERYRDGGSHGRGYADLHDHVLALHRAGLLIVVDEPINKDNEMHPLVRWQYRGGIAESDRRAFLFTAADRWQRCALRYCRPGRRPCQQSGRLPHRL
jgi:hypothetical protein